MAPKIFFFHGLKFLPSIVSQIDLLYVYALQRWWFELLDWGERKEESHIPFFFTFYLIRQSPLKSSNPDCVRYTHPPTTNITPLCSSHNTLHRGGGFIGIGWVWWEWLVILRPLQPTSPDKTHTTMLPRECPTRPYEYHGHWSRFPN